jgi:hypothetical protein
MITNDIGCTPDIISRIAMTEEVFKKNQNHFTNNLELSKKLAECHIWSIALCGAET